MHSRLHTLTKIFMLNILRQRSVLFSSFILPIIVIWSTWWITAEFPMTFSLALSDITINANMLDVHVITGGLTAMAITAGLFSFILTSENNRIQSRLKLFGYSNIEINMATIIALIGILSLSAVISTILSLNLADEKSWQGIAIAIVMITLIYTALGNLLGNIYPKVIEGTLIMLIIAFIDLMLLTNPMGEGLYLKDWTYYLPGFWPVQVALESGFYGFPDQISKIIGRTLIYLIIILGSTQIVKSKILLKISDRVRNAL